jgi:hypothetical protein
VTGSSKAALLFVLWFERDDAHNLGAVSFSNGNLDNHVYRLSIGIT